VAPAVLVFVMTGCPACHEYVPRFRKAFRGARILDVSRDRRAAALADRLGVKATPTTVVRDSAGTVTKRIGAISDADIGKLLGKLT
jgi:hypothetical protein